MHAQSTCAAVGGSVCSRGPQVTLVQCCVPSLTAENFGQVHGLVAFLLGVQPLALCFVFGFSCCTEENRFFRLPEVRDAHPVPREGTCQGTWSSDAFKEKSPFEWSCGGSVSPPSSAGSFSAACTSLLECCSHPLGTCFLTCLWKCRASAIPLTSVESCEMRRPGCPEARGCLQVLSCVWSCGCRDTWPPLAVLWAVDAVQGWNCQRVRS